jgi:ureidoacrylate peracid hydrolase
MPGSIPAASTINPSDLRGIFRRFRASGIATNICCETTAREAMARDFCVLFLSDGTSASALPGALAADIQRVTLATLGFLFAQVLTVDEMISKIDLAG